MPSSETSAGGLDKCTRKGKRGSRGRPHEESVVLFFHSTYTVSSFVGARHRDTPPQTELQAGSARDNILWRMRVRITGFAKRGKNIRVNSG